MATGDVMVAVWVGLRRAGKGPVVVAIGPGAMMMMMIKGQLLLQSADRGPFQMAHVLPLLLLMLGRGPWKSDRIDWV